MGKLNGVVGEIERIVREAVLESLEEAVREMRAEMVGERVNAGEASPPSPEMVRDLEAMVKAEAEAGAAIGGSGRGVGAGRGKWKRLAKPNKHDPRSDEQRGKGERREEIILATLARERVAKPARINYELEKAGVGLHSSTLSQTLMKLRGRGLVRRVAVGQWALGAKGRAVAVRKEERGER